MLKKKSLVSPYFLSAIPMLPSTFQTFIPEFIHLCLLNIYCERHMCWKRYNLCPIQVSVAIVTSYHKLSSLNQINLLCHSYLNQGSDMDDIGLTSRC